MLDLASELEELFAQPSVWESSTWIDRVNWIEARKIDPGRLESIQRARQKYVESHPDRVDQSQRKQAKRRWQAVRSDPAKLAARRAYQRSWIRSKQLAKQQAFDAAGAS